MSQRIPESVIEEIRTQINIVDVVGQYVQLKKSGKNYFGLCPFHEERSPSFSVAEDKQIYHCFGCGKGGNVFSFIQEIDGLNFPEAVKKIADLGQISLEFDLGTVNEQTAPTEGQRQQQALIELHETAAELYHHILLNTQAGEEALTYLTERGLSPEIIREFQIGFAPRERILLQKVFENEAVAENLLAESGLMTQRDDGTWLDRFYQRIMFPIKNSQGKIVAFSGRVLAQADYDTTKMPKYLNSPETDIFNKRRILFNYHVAKAEARKSNELILFEGFMDVIAANRAGLKNGVASMGTSLTNEHLQMIQRSTNSVLLCYDGDLAGIEATKRALDLLESQTALEIGIVSLPDGLDPDDYIKKYNPEQFANLIKNGRETQFTFKMNYFKKGRNLQNEQERFNYLELLVKELVKVPSMIEREVYIKQLSQEFGISIEAINEEIQTAQQSERREHQLQQRNRRQEQQRVEPVKPQVQQIKPITVGEKAEQMLLFRIMSERAVQGKINQLADFSFIHDEYQEIYTHFNDYMLTQGEFKPADFLNYLQADYLKEKFVKIAYLDLSEESSLQEIDDYLLVLQQERLRQIQQAKIIEQKEASRTGNKQLEQELAVEIINLQRKLKSVR